MTVLKPHPLIGRWLQITSHFNQWQIILKPRPLIWLGAGCIWPQISIDNSFEATPSDLIGALAADDLTFQSMTNYSEATPSSLIGRWLHMTSHFHRWQFWSHTLWLGAGCIWPHISIDDKLFWSHALWSDWVLAVDDFTFQSMTNYSEATPSSLIGRWLQITSHFNQWQIILKPRPLIWLGAGCIWPHISIDDSSEATPSDWALTGDEFTFTSMIHFSEATPTDLIRHWLQTTSCNLTFAFIFFFYEATPPDLIGCLLGTSSLFHWWRSSETTPLIWLGVDNLTVALW